MSYILPILGLVALLFFWVLFQQWLKRKDPGQFYRPGCGACGSNGSCSPQSLKQAIKFQGKTDAKKRYNNG